MAKLHLKGSHIEEEEEDIEEEKHLYKINNLKKKHSKKDNLESINFK